MPLHASIQEQCRAIGFDNLAPIIWHKIANARLESEGNGAGFLGKPYEPNAVIKNDIEYILMQRNPGDIDRYRWSSEFSASFPRPNTMPGSGRSGTGRPEPLRRIILRHSRRNWPND